MRASVDAIDKGPVGTVATCRDSDIATLSRTSSHLIQFSIDFKDGAANDTVKIYIDGKLSANGATWENYYRYDRSRLRRAIRSRGSTSCCFASAALQIPPTP